MQTVANYVAAGSASLPPFSPPRWKTHKSYDPTAWRTVGALYAPDTPEVAWTVDFLHLLLCARQLGVSHAQQRRLVEEYTTLRPISLGPWERLSQQAKYFIYVSAAEEQRAPLTHMLTLHLPHGFDARARAKGHGPVRRLRTFLNKHLDDVFLHRDETLRYILKVELTRAGSGRHVQLGNSLSEFHGTILLDIPDALLRSVRKRLAHVTNTPGSALSLQNSGRNAHLQRIKPNRAFGRGRHATGRFGLAGAADYAGKDFHHLAALQAHHRRHGSPLAFDKICGASRDISSHARTLYADLTAIVRAGSLSAAHRQIYTAEDVRHAFVSAARIVGSHPNLYHLATYL